MLYIFEIEPGGNFELNSQFGSIWQHSFSTGGIVIEDQLLPAPVYDESTSSSDQSDDNAEIEISQEDEQDYSSENSLEHIDEREDISHNGTPTIPSNVDTEEVTTEVTTRHDVTISDNIVQESGATAMTSPENGLLVYLSCSDGLINFY